MFRHQIAQRSLIGRSHFVREHNRRVDDLFMYELERLKVTVQTVTEKDRVLVEKLHQVGLHLPQCFVAVFERFFSEPAPPRVVIKYLCVGFN